MRAPLVAVFALALAACDGAGISAPTLTGRSAPDTVRVARGDVVIAGPQGYCIDRRGSKLTGDAAFVLLASCASLTGQAEAGAPFAPGLLTASVDRDPGNVPELTAFRDFLGTDAGKATLARDGQAASVDVLEMLTRDGALLMKIRDRSPAANPGLEGTYWRGLFVLNERLITVTVNAFDVRPLGTDAGRLKLIQFIDRIRAESPRVEPAADTGPPQGGLFRRLLR